MRRGRVVLSVLVVFAALAGVVMQFGLPGPVPCYRVYDRNGKLQREFAVDPRAAKQFMPADVDAAVEELL